MSDPTPSPAPPPQYRWPKIALVFVVLFIAMSVWFMAKEVRRVQRIRAESEDLRKSSLPTNPPPAPPVR